MHSHWAAEHLLVIRTLMERSAIYRRALAPIVLALGALGLVGAVAGRLLQIEVPRLFIGYWSGIGMIGISAAYILARRDALKAAESFWSAPTRRVTQALLPPLFVGFVASSTSALVQGENAWSTSWIVPVWMVLYGCAVHAAGFFMPRGMKIFGWGFILTGCILALSWATLGRPASLASAHLLMGGSFGLFHLAYGIYLSFTENRKNEA